MKADAIIDLLGLLVVFLLSVFGRGALKKLWKEVKGTLKEMSGKEEEKAQGDEQVGTLWSEVKGTLKEMYANKEEQAPTQIPVKKTPTPPPMQLPDPAPVPVVEVVEKPAKVMVKPKTVCKKKSRMNTLLSDKRNLVLAEAILRRPYGRK